MLELQPEPEDNRSLAEIVAEMSPEDQEKVWAGMSEEQLALLQYEADFWLRPKQIIPDGDWYITALVAGRGFGKLTSVYDKIPTPSGWRYVGEVEDGDLIFDENGQACTVLKAHEVQIPEVAYRLTFSDGTYIDAGGEHLWTTWTHADRKAFNRRNEYIASDEDSVGVPHDWPSWTKTDRWGHPTGIGPKVRTTQEIVDTLRHGKRGDLNHSIPVTKPLQYPTADLAADPYVFGLWLGDGSKAQATITCHLDEIEWMTSEVERRGYPTNVHQTSNPARNCRNFGVIGLSAQLARQESIGTKLIPRQYLEGDERQRRDLLAGLLDTDGFIDPNTHYIEFCSKRRDHADAVVELARSLGQKPKVYVGRATLGGRDYGEKYRVCWRPTENFFYMPRKAAAFVPLGAQASRSMHRMIVSAERIPSPPMRCFTVDSKNSLYLVGEGMIPTHNTLAMAQWVRKMAMTHKGCRIGIAARTSADVRNTVVTGESGILAVHPDHERPEYKPSTTSLHWPNGSSALLLSSESPDSARGPQFHYAVGDEFAAWKTTPDSSGATLYDNLIAATRLGDNPQLLLATTPKRTKVMRDLMTQSQDPKERIRVVRGSTFENKTLSNLYIENLVRRYGNSDLAKQELEGMMLEDAEGIVFSTEMIEAARVEKAPPALPIRIISVDPSVSGDPSNSDECGIIAIGSTAERDLTQRTAYVLEDYSLRATPDVWAQQVAYAAEKHRTKFVVVEKNQGGQLLQMAINAVDPTLKVFLVVATQGKRLRAEPVVIKMQQGRVKLCGEDGFPVLEDQLLFYDPDETGASSPDRMDAFVWGVISVLISPPEGLRGGSFRAKSAVNRKIPTGAGPGFGAHRSHYRAPRPTPR